MLGSYQCIHHMWLTVATSVMMANLLLCLQDKFITIPSSHVDLRPLICCSGTNTLGFLKSPDVQPCECRTRYVTAVRSHHHSGQGDRVDLDAPMAAAENYIPYKSLSSYFDLYIWHHFGHNLSPFHIYVRFLQYSFSCVRSHMYHTY